MQKLVTLLLTTTVLVGCDGETRKEPDWRLNGGCDKYFSVSTREYADCKAFVKKEEEKTKAASTPADNKQASGVSLDPQGAYVKEDENEKINRDSERTLTD